MAPGPRLASGRSTCSTPPSCAASRRSRTPGPGDRGGRGPDQRLHRRSWSAAWSSTSPASTRCWRRTPRAGRSTGCPPSTATCCGCGVYELLYVDDVPDARRGERGDGAGAGAVDRRVAAVRQRRAGQHPAATSPRWPERGTGPAVTEGQALAHRAHQSDWIDHAARIGLVAYGLVHVVIGWLALQLALGDPSGSASSTGAIRELAEQPFGLVLVLAGGGRDVPAHVLADPGGRPRPS